jgi:hypothetical protein
VRELRRDQRLQLELKFEIEREEDGLWLAAVPAVAGLAARILTKKAKRS